MAARSQYTLIGFWIMVLKRSIISWHRVEGILALLTFVSIIWLGLSSFGAFRDLIDHLVQSIFSVIACSWLVFLIVLYTPYQMWKEVSQSRDSLQDIKDYEKLIDKLSEFFDYGNNELLNADVKDNTDYGIWSNKWKTWSEDVEEFLKDNFGLAEKNMFKNNVLFKDYSLSGLPGTNHNKNRSLVAKQLETLRGIMIRYGERIQKWHAANT